MASCVCEEKRKKKPTSSCLARSLSFAWRTVRALAMQQLDASARVASVWKTLRCCAVGTKHRAALGSFQLEEAEEGLARTSMRILASSLSSSSSSLHPALACIPAACLAMRNNRVRLHG